MRLLLDSTSPSRLTPCHLPYRGEALAYRNAFPLRQRFPYKGQRRRPPPAAETGSRCWGRGQQDASESEADAGSRNPGSVTGGDGEGKPVAKRLLTQRWASAFVKAIGSLCKSFYSGILALSGAPRQLSQRESLCRG